MDQRDVEIEDTQKLIEDEVVGDQECVENEQLGLKGDKQEETPGLVNVHVQNPNETVVEQEKPSKKDKEEVDANKSEQELPVDETQDDAKDATAMEDDKVHDSDKDATAMDGDKLHDSNKDGVAMDDDKIHDSNKDGVAMDDDKIHDSNKDGVAMDDDKIHDSNKDGVAMDDDKIHDSNKDGAAMDDDKIHDSNKDAAPMDDDKIHDGNKDGAAMDDENGVLDEPDHDATVKLPENNNEGDYIEGEEHQELATPKALVKRSPSKAEDHSAELPKNELEGAKMDEGYESGTAEDQETFMKEVETFYKEKNLEFKPPKFYGQPLNCLKLWRAVVKLGGYDRVTGSKWWRQVGESFHPPKTCTTVSWTFRQFYEKALLEYERHKLHNGELELPLATAYPEAPTVENEANGHQTPGSGRARRDAAARAMQGWHAQRLLGFSEEKNPNNSQKREKSLKSIGSLKQKRPSEMEHPVKAARIETSRQVVTTVADVGPPANWVKINVRETKDCFEVYALVPGLLREEVRVQSDPAGRLVITGQPEQLDNPWGITAFKKVISLPSRIDPLRTSAIVSLHGRLLVRVPFEQSNI